MQDKLLFIRYTHYSSHLKSFNKCFLAH